RFHTDPGVIGRTVWLQGLDAVITGVTPGEFNGTSVETSPDVWAPFSAVTRVSSDLNLSRLDKTLPDLLFRLHPGVSFSQAKTEFDRIWTAYLNSDLSAETKSFESRFRIEIES